MKLPANNLFFSFLLLIAMLSVIWWPTFFNFADVWAFAQVPRYGDLSLFQVFVAEIVILLTVWYVLYNYKGKQETVYGYQLVRRHFILNSFVVGQVFVGFIAGGFLVHQDASWYQVMHDENDVMPAQAIILLVCYPMYLFFGGSAYLYARARLSHFAELRKTTFLIFTFAPFVFLPYYDVGLVEAQSEYSKAIYLVVYWVLSVSWLVFGVGHLVLKSSKQILKGLSEPYDEQQP